MPVVGFAVGVNLNADRLTDSHVSQLGLLVIRRHPHLIQVDYGKQWLSGLDDLARLDRLLAHGAGDGRANGGVLQFQFSLLQRCLEPLYVSGGSACARSRDSHLLWCRFCPFHLRLCLDYVTARVLHGGTCGIHSSSSLLFSRQCGVMPLAGNLISRHQLLHALQLCEGPIMLRLSFTQPGLCGCHFLLGCVQIRLCCPQLAGRAGGRDGHAGTRCSRRCFRVLQLRPRPLYRICIIGWVELHQHSPSLDILVIVHVYFHDSARYAGTDGSNMTIDLGVVR